MKRQCRRVPWIVPYISRKKFSRKIKKTLQDITLAKNAGEWYKCIKMRSKLRRVWWGIKKFTK